LQQTAARGSVSAADQRHVFENSPRRFGTNTAQRRLPGSVPLSRRMHEDKVSVLRQLAAFLNDAPSMA
jgi:hypothetical protein